MLWGCLDPPARATYPHPPLRWVAATARSRLANLGRGEISGEKRGQSYDRVGATSRSHGRAMGRELIGEGLAVVWCKFSRGAYTAAKREARRARRGG